MPSVRRVFAICACVVALTGGAAHAQGESPHLLLLAPHGTRIARLIPEIENYVDTVIAGLTGVTAIRYDEADSMFVVVCGGDSVGHNAGLLRFLSSQVLKQRILQVDTIAIADSEAPADVMYVNPPRAYVTMRNTGRIVDMTALGTFLRYIPLPGRPTGMVRISATRAMVICAKSPKDDSSHVALLDTDGDSVLRMIAVPGVAEWGTLDFRFRVHVLSHLPTGNSRVTVLRADLGIDSTLDIPGVATQISMSAAVDTLYQRVLLSNGANDTLVAQYNPSTLEIFPVRTLRAATAIGFASQLIGISRFFITIYDPGPAGTVSASGSIQVPALSPVTAFMDVLPVSLSGIAVSPMPELSAFTLRAFPQPASTRVQLAVNHAGSATMMLYDCLGRMLMRGESDAGTWRMDASFLPSGVYVCEARQDGHSARCLLRIAH